MDDGEHSSTIVEGVPDISFKKRHRKKYLYKQILKQMEFYFSDANLIRDRFLGKLLQENKNISLEVFLSFNRIRELTDSCEEIANALGNSELLKITEDRKHVYRTTEVQKKENQDDCMIYVEQLPPDANHDWVTGIFSAYGTVEYVSIPKYRNRPANKGYAFVEFDTPEAAKKALEAFGSAGCCLPAQMPPEELCSVVTNEYTENREETKNQEKQSKKHKLSQRSCEYTEEAGELAQIIDDKETEIEEPKSKKLKADKEEHIEKHKKKKRKDKNDEDNNPQVTSEDGVADGEAAEPIKMKKGKKRKLENEDSEICLEEGTNDSQIKKKKKRDQVDDDGIDMKSDAEKQEPEVSVASAEAKKSKKKKRKQQEGADCEDDAEDEGTAKSVKKRTDEEDDGNAEDVETAGDTDKSDKKRTRKRNKKKKSVDKKDNDPVSLGLRIISRREWCRLRNKYLNLQKKKMHNLKKHLRRAKFGSSYQSPYPAKEYARQEVGKKRNSASDTKKFVSGVIIHIDLAEPLRDVITFKNSVKAHPEVVYVDANEGDSEVHIRCTSAEASRTLVSNKQWDNMNVLQGEAETMYWKKIQKDRESKIKDKVRVNQRGRNKLLKRAERELGKHIKFDD